jgi:hypothetical protein
MNMTSKFYRSSCLLAILAVPAWGALSAQQQADTEAEVGTTVTGSPPADLTGLVAGPDIEGFISARSDERIQVTGSDGSNTIVYVSDGTEIRASKGLFGLNRDKLAAGALLNGLPVTAKTVQWGGGLVAS